MEFFTVRPRQGIHFSRCAVLLLTGTMAVSSLTACGAKTMPETPAAAVSSTAEEASASGITSSVKAADAALSEAELLRTLEEAFSHCYGYEGTAGSSLKAIRGADSIFTWANSNNAASMDPDRLASLIETALSAMDSASVQKFIHNWQNTIKAFNDSVFSDYKNTQIQLRDSGIETNYDEILESGDAGDNWTAFRDALDSAVSGYDNAAAADTASTASSAAN